MQKVNNLFDYGEKSLTMEQAVECLTKFQKSFEPLLADNKVTMKRENDTVRVTYNPRSNSDEVPKPKCRIEIIQACTGVENMIVVEMSVSDVAECRSTSLAKFNKPNLVKFDKILDNAHKLFAERLEAAHKKDEEQVAWDNTVAEIRKLCNFNTKTIKRKDSEYSDTKDFIGKNRGHLYDYDSEKDFSVELKHLTPDQMRILGPVIAKL